MRGQIQITVFIMVLILFSCTESADQEFEGFTEKQAQEVSERTVSDLTVVDSLNISKAFNPFSISNIRLSKKAIFGKLGNQVVKLDKQNLSEIGKYTIPQGRGPGEIVDFDLTWLGAGDETFSLYDSKAKKTALYDLNGNFEEEFLNGSYQIQEMDMADKQTYYFQLFPGREYMFIGIERTGNDSVIRHQFQPFTEGRNFLAYSGAIEYHNNSLFYAGYSEPIIRRYDINKDTTDLVFSRAVIDDYESENNYETPEEGVNVRVWSWAEEAQYASEDIAVDDRYLYSVRHHNDKEGYKYLDLYSTEDGAYEGSFTLQYYPEEIAVDEEFIYTLEESGDDKYLMKYQKPAMDF